MIIVDDLKNGIDAILHPDKATAKSMDLGAAAVMYYKFALVPLILGIIVEFAIGSALGAGGAILDYILYPIGLLIGAAIVFFLGKYLFRWFKGTYNGAFTATVFGVFPSVLLAWLVSGIASLSYIPGIIVAFVIGLCGLYVSVVAYANQQKCTRLQALITVIIPAIVVLIVVLAVGGTHVLGMQ